MNTRSRIAVLASLLCTLCGCAGKHAFLMVQLCLGNEQNVALFIDTMKSISLSQHMSYGDRSAASQDELTTVKASPNYRLLNIGAASENGVGWGATNLGLSAYEIVLGFDEGSNPTEARQFADSVVRKLKKKWPVYVVPAGRGAVPMKSCQGRSEIPGAPNSASP